MSIIAVADGHGDPNCFRSKEGSRFACESAIESLVEFCANVDAGELTSEERQPKIIKQLIDAVLGKWYSKVEADMAVSPFEDVELEKVDQKYRDRFAGGKRVETAYGSTLICVAVMDAYSIALQIGDGSCVFFSYDEAKATQPVPEDEECHQNITTSICDTNAAEKFRWYVTPELPLAIFAGSDGIEDSFANNEELQTQYRKILEIFGEYGYDRSVQEVEEYLPNITKKGSGDDVSIAGIIDIATAGEITELLTLQTKIFSLHQEFDRLNEDIMNIASMGKRFVEQYKESIGEINGIQKIMAKKSALENANKNNVAKLFNAYKSEDKKQQQIEAERADLEAAIEEKQGSLIKQKERLTELKERQGKALAERDEIKSQARKLIEARNASAEAAREKMKGHLTAEAASHGYSNAGATRASCETRPSDDITAADFIKDIESADIPGLPDIPIVSIEETLPEEQSMDPEEREIEPEKQDDGLEGQEAESKDQKAEEMRQK